MSKSPPAPGSAAPGAAETRRVPSMLDIIRLSPRPIFPPGGRHLYRRVALLTGMEAGQELLVAACGAGVTLEYFVREFGVQGSGVEEDVTLVERIEERARAEGLSHAMQAQQGSMDALPYRNGVFDIAIGEFALAARVDPEAAISELARVVRPGGRVVLIQLVWRAPVEERRREILARHLGARPLLTMEAKKILRRAGIEDLHAEAWTDDETSFRSTRRKPFHDFAELFTFSEKLRIHRRAWRRWGWRGVREAMARELEVHRLLTRERILGLDMISGVRAEAPEPEVEADPAADPAALAFPADPAGPSSDPAADPPPN